MSEVVIGVEEFKGRESYRIVDAEKKTQDNIY